MSGAIDLIAQLARKGTKKKGKKGRKLGRYGKHPSSVRYRTERRWEKNQLRRIARHVRKYPDDMQARAAYQRITGRELPLPTVAA